MVQVFSRNANAAARAILLAIASGVLAGAAGAALYVHSSGFTGAGRTVEQPVPFSHKHHVSGLGIGCRYCHATAEVSSSAGMPSSETCMTCHSQLWTRAPMLRPVRESLRSGEPLRWRRVHDLADFVYFDHSVHVAQGVACESCHGRVDRMPLMQQVAPLDMAWCLDCHRAPERALRPKDEVYAMGWSPPDGRSREDLGRSLMAARGIRAEQITDCSVCHR